MNLPGLLQAPPAGYNPEVYGLSNFAERRPIDETYFMRKPFRLKILPIPPPPWRRWGETFIRAPPTSLSSILKVGMPGGFSTQVSRS